ncbi:DegQ family serine endoprotease [Azospirillum halopraeferens]|uniref:DegQ family serine endoprotease n=1 Tax=Azospirillum halopraeferens TaxID=34010 RepID=UPI0004238B21|nr:DegQ family serine endoprotease [Azospirillum halopraeferens]
MSNLMSGRGTPTRLLRRAVAAVLLGTTVLAGGTALATAQPTAPAAITAPLPPSFAPLVERVQPAVVTITARREATPAAERRAAPSLPFPPGSPFEEFFRRFGAPFGEPDAPQPPRGRGGSAVGSGFVIDGEGHVVTNNHVIDGATAIAVTLTDGTELPATVVGRDPKTDLALLKVTGDRTLPYLAFGDSDGTRVGDWVVAVGNPFGLGGSVTTGIVSARGRHINAGPYDDFIQTDAAINRGNSGGPMFNLAGEVIGINTAIYSPNGGSVGIGFAIPSNLARTVIAQLKESGRVERGWLGVRIQEVTPELGQALGLGEARGALLADVTADSPAARAGLRQGDVVLRFDGKPVGEVRDLSRAVAEARPDSTAEVVVSRDGREQALSVRVGAMPGEERVAAAPDGSGDAATDTVKGLRLAALDRNARAGLGLDDGVTGVVVAGLEDGAGETTLRPGDVIVRVGDRSVATPADVASTVAEAEKAGRKAVLLLINRRGTESFVALRLSQA